MGAPSVTHVSQLPPSGSNRHEPHRVDANSIAETQRAIKSPENLLPLLPGHDHRLIIASSEGGGKTTTDQDDPEGIRRAVQLIRNLPKDEQNKITFVAYVNTNRNKKLPAETTTRDGADDLVDYLAGHGIDRASIHRELALDADTGNYKPGIYVLYGDDPGDGRGSVGLEGSFDPKTDLHPSRSTEVSILMAASPSGLSEVPAHNVSLVGNGRNATNDNYGAPGESPQLLKTQSQTVKKYLEGQGFRGEALDTQLKAHLEKRQIVYDFEAAFADSLSGAKREALFGNGSGLDAKTIDRIKKGTEEKIKQNEMHTLGLVDAASPDGAYGNRTFKGADEILGIKEDAFKSGLSNVRKSMVGNQDAAAFKGPDFLYATQLPALVKYVHTMTESGNVTPNTKTVDTTLSQATGFDFGLGANRREKLLQYVKRPEVLGAKFAPRNAESVGAMVDAMPTQDLAAAVAIHLKGVQTQMNLLFPLVSGSSIPATSEAFSAMVKSNGGWESSKIPDYDTLAMSKLLFPKLDPANVMCAIDIPDRS
jgi:hypothetical protein